MIQLGQKRTDLALELASKHCCIGCFAGKGDHIAHDCSLCKACIARKHR